MSYEKLDGVDDVEGWREIIHCVMCGQYSRVADRMARNISARFRMWICEV